MRFYNVLLNDKFCIDVDHFKLIYSVLEIIYVFYIDKNYCFITFKHILKTLMKIFLFLWIFDTFLKISKFHNFLLQNMRFYNVLWNDGFFINVTLFKMVYMSPESIYMLHIVENHFFIIFTHFWKISENFQTNFMNFWQFFENLLKFRFFWVSQPIFVGQKMCLVCARTQKFFLSRNQNVYI